MATRSGRVIGALALLAAALTTGVNETRLMRAQRSLEYGRHHALALAEPKIDARNDGALVLFSGLITTNAVVLDSSGHALAHARSPFVMDPVFGVAVRGVRLTRTVEMLQWVETQHTTTSPTTGGGEYGTVDEDRERVYMYDLRWRADRVDSAAFNNPSYRNPTQYGEPWLFESTTIQAPDVVVGDFPLSDALLDQITRHDAVALDTASRRAMQNVLDMRLGEHWIDRSVVRNASVEIDDTHFVIRAAGAAATSRGREPVLGDLRVSFTVTPAHAVTVCAQQQQQMLVPFATAAGDSIYLLEGGIHSVTELFDRKTETKFRANRFPRLFASVVAFIGFLTLHPLLMASRAARGLPLTKLPAPAVAAVLSCSLTFTVAAACWLRMRVLYAAAMFVGGATPTLVLFCILRLLQQRAKQE